MTFSPNHGELREPRIGCALHYTGGGFVESVAWCRVPKGPTNDNPVSYHVIIAPDGAAVQLVPWDRRAWHMGNCRPSQTSRSYEDANSAFYGIALAGGPEFGRPTDAQEQTLNGILFDRFHEHQWSLGDWWRVVGHDTECWPRTRKHDPTGDSHGYGPSSPWLSLDGVRAALAATQQ
jgi:N-acetyl-anhydromuramyl-L-alanine amidase AmpD